MFSVAWQINKIHMLTYQRKPKYAEYRNQPNNSEENAEVSSLSCSLKPNG